MGPLPAGDEDAPPAVSTEAWWSTTNLGEAIPGVLTPLNWAFWGDPGERAARQAFRIIGAISAAEAALPADPQERMFALFHGRFALKVDFLARVGDRLPGTTGAAIAEQILGHAPAGLSSRPTSRRLPVIAVRLPTTFVSLPRRMTALQRRTAIWWGHEITRSGALELEPARQQWHAAAERFEHTLTWQTTCLFAGVQPIYDQVAQLVARSGRPELGARLMAGQGSHAELAMVEDLWRLSREQLDIEAFIARHGYHGPQEGEISSRMWREDDGPVLAMAKQYAAKPDAESPLAVAELRARERTEARAELLAAVPQRRRASAKVVLALADRYIPLRGVGKAAFLQALDVGRAATRAIGGRLVGAGVLDDPEDVFYLTGDELLTAGPGADLGGRVAERRAERLHNQTLTLPRHWQGIPTAIGTSREERRPELIRLEAIGASPGVVEARVRVVEDPSFAEVEPGEILVAPTTDPGWASIMFTSAALVVELGGQLSHAAVVARELGIPCVMGLEGATRLLATGDLCRVDGAAGTVEVLERSQLAV